MRMLVCGGRDFQDHEMLNRVLDRWARSEIIDCVIEGNAQGVDRMAGLWARKRGIENIKFTADWGQYGRSAGILRNQKMLDDGRPDIVIAFPGGRGTADMIRRARKAAIDVCQVLQSGDVVA